jgi:putative addiction module killer protein
VGINFVIRKVYSMTESKKKTVEIYQTTEGKKPYEDWFDSLKDARAIKQVLIRIKQVEEGNFGDHHSITGGNGLAELRIKYGSGFRIYYGETEKEIVLLLCGGDKSTQKKDIKLAKQYWADYLNRPDKEESNEQTTDEITNDETSSTG